MTTAGATLSGSFSGITTNPAPTAAFFRYGTSRDALNSVVYDNQTLLNTTSGTFSANVSSLSPNTTYYYQAVMTMADGTDVAGEIRSFMTTAASPTVNRTYLDCYEMPAVTVTDYASGKETFGSTKYHAYGTANSMQKVVTHTFSYNGTKRNYSLLYDGNKKAALWVAFAMNADSYPWLADRSDSWKADPALPSAWQPDLSSAYADNYSRGHQCASNDRRTTTDQTKQTTYFSNMTPQLSGFNGGVWAKLEQDVQDIGKNTSGSDTLYVVTGPVFGTGYGTAKDKSGTVCAVPTQYFKCIMKVHFSGGTPVSATGAAYLFKHEDKAARQEVSIDDIEDLTGFDFFTHVPADLQNAAEAEKHPTTYF